MSNGARGLREIQVVARNYFRRLRNKPPVVFTECRAHQVSRYRILGLSMVKNEQDIIEPFVRHNMRSLDSLVVIDNGSSDRTREILGKLAREFSDLVCIDDAEFAFRQSQRMTTLLHAVQSERPADFAVFLDADEFLTAKSREAFEAALDTIPRGGAGLMPWRTYLVTPSTIDEAATDPPRSMVWRRKVEGHAVYKSILRLDRALRPDIRVSHGAHAMFLATGGKVPEVVLVDRPLAHFPVRSSAQLTAKSVIGWAALVKLNPRVAQTPMAWQWRKNCEAIARVVYDPMPFEYQRAYSDGSFADPVYIIGRAWARSLVENESGVDSSAPADRNSGA